MPVIDRIKISQEINFNGMPTWIGLEATLLADENEKDGLRQLQKVISEYQDEEQKAFNGSRWGRKSAEVPAVSMIEQMDACTELTKDPDNGLLSFELTIKSPEEKLFYDAKVIELTNKNK